MKVRKEGGWRRIDDCAGGGQGGTREREREEESPGRQHPKDDTFSRETERERELGQSAIALPFKNSPATAPARAPAKDPTRAKTPRMAP